MSDTKREGQWKGERAILMGLMIAAGFLAIALLATIVFRS